MIEESGKSSNSKNNSNVSASAVLSMAKRRGIIWPAYEIYGGVAGFYDYGPIGAGLRNNIISVWRKYFVFGERCAEIETANVTPEEVFIASGHVEEFKDFMVQCTKCGSAFRADHLVSDIEVNADNLSKEELEDILINNNIRCLDCKGELSPPRPVNLMFETNIGLGKPRHAYLRPETAQGMFINFHNLYRYFREKLPFGAAQIGRGFRNEISPRQGIIRLREMTMAELEYFFNPSEEKFGKVNSVLDVQVKLVPEPGKELNISIKEALEQKIIDSEISAYFIGLTTKFLSEVGLDMSRIRFRKHQSNEMAHYAKECWDAEALTSFDWLEIIGIANRSAFDLSAHIKSTGQELSAFIPYEKPVERRSEKVVADMKKLGPLFKGAAAKIKDKLEGLDVSDVKGKGQIEIEIDNETFQVPGECFNIEELVEKVSGERIIPNVLEPSFGIDRILYSLLEQSYVESEPPADIESDSTGVYRVLTFLPQVAPIKVGVFPLMPKDGLVEIAQRINSELREIGIETYYDESGSIGRRYARMDEVGTPFCITVDYDTKDDSAVTIRDRDSHAQVRIKIDELSMVIEELIMGKKLFSEL
jgi:glycyl-tRNA synthetase